MWILTFYIELYYISDCKNLNHFTCYKCMYDVTYMILVWFVDEKAIVNENFMTCWGVWWLITLCFRSIGAFILCFFTSSFLYRMLLPVCNMFPWMCMYAWWNEIFVQALQSVIPCRKKSMKFCRMVIFKDTHCYQMAQGIKCSYHRHLVLACTVVGKYMFYNMWYRSIWLSISSLRTLFGMVLFLCSIVWASLQLLFHSC